MSARSAFGQRVAAAVGSRLRRLRKERGLTQRAIAQRTGLWRPIVGRVERGTHVPTLDVVARYCAALGVPLTDVLSVLDGMQPGAPLT